MATVSERARELAEKFSKVRYVFPPDEVTARGFTVEAFQRVSEIVEKEIARYTLANLPKLIEQALLAERRESAKAAVGALKTMRLNLLKANGHYCGDYGEALYDAMTEVRTAILRAAAEKEVGK